MTQRIKHADLMKRYQFANHLLLNYEHDLEPGTSLYLTIVS